MLLSKGKLVAFVSNSAWSVYNFRLDVIRKLIEDGYDVLVIATTDEYTSLLKEAGCRFVHVHFNNRTNNPFDDFVFYRKLKNIYRHFHPDFIFHYVTKPNIYGSLAAASLGIPSVAVITGLGYAFARKNWLNRLVIRLYRQALHKVNETWFLNQEDADRFLEQAIIDSNNFTVLPGEGVNTTRFRPEEKTQPAQPAGIFEFLMSARLLRSKGIPVYAEAVKLLKAKGYAVHCRLIGFFEKHHPDSLTSGDLQRWHKEGLIFYEGFAKDVRPFLKAADCVVFPSAYNEGVPRCLMEAASMELPVITTNTPGCKDVLINEVTGYFCKINDAADLAVQMEKMMGLTKEERKRMGHKGRELVISKFEISRVVAEYLRVLTSTFKKEAL
jgi:glycosyltransferase involved in cell wall biosynthesis